ncbi:RDD family protein [Streptomyces sp. B1866]|uniref:RDD family protein n=1 Tax=Streptomyces sp. B1866 TaxID=3075431 RepID=UPI0028919182|nr:RDD family protein [Streptomyces sp. B1866]MDT3398883.1 RDD family protein [Streptomyces sp. B1866]
MNELVTGEAVVLGLRPARLPSRALAVFLDMVLAWIAYLAVSLALLTAVGSLDEAAMAALSVALFALVLVGGPIAVETLTHGRSVGKMVCGLRVVRDDGGPIRFRHALVRGAVGVVEILGSAGTIACVASLVSARGRRIGDVFAGTLVVRERVPVTRSAPLPPPPPWLAGRFAGLDLSRVPDGLWLAVRQVLTRMPQLDPDVAWAMTGRLAADVAERTGAPAPEGVPPAAYLSAVLAERQARDARRVLGAEFGYGQGWGGVPGPAWAGRGSAVGAFGGFGAGAVTGVGGPGGVGAYGAGGFSGVVGFAGAGGFSGAAGVVDMGAAGPGGRSGVAEDGTAVTGFVPPA